MDSSSGKYSRVFHRVWGKWCQWIQNFYERESTPCERSLRKSLTKRRFFVRFFRVKKELSIGGQGFGRITVWENSFRKQLLCMRREM